MNTSGTPWVSGLLSKASVTHMDLLSITTKTSPLLLSQLLQKALMVFSTERQVGGLSDWPLSWKVSERSLASTHWCLTFPVLHVLVFEDGWEVAFRPQRVATVKWICGLRLQRDAYTQYSVFITSVGCTEKDKHHPQEHTIEIWQLTFSGLNVK